MNCPNCGAIIDERYCSRCGQDRQALDLRMWPWLREAVAEAAGVEGSLWRTLRVLFTRPGALTVEWREGRRARFVSPLRLYLLAAVVFFTVGALWPGNTSALGEFVAGFTEGIAEGGGSHAPLQSERGTAFNARAGETVQRLMIVLVPFSAWLCSVAFRRGGRYFLEYIVFALHFHVFYFLLRAASYVLPGDLEETMVLMLAIALLAYVAAAARRAFGFSWAGSTARAAVVLAVYGIALGMSAVLIGAAGRLEL